VHSALGGFLLRSIYVLGYDSRDDPRGIGTGHGLTGRGVSVILIAIEFVFMRVFALCVYLLYA
jgi:hypothetical protein